MDTELVTIRHPEIETTGTSTRQAFDVVWAPRGWELIEETPSSADIPPESEASSSTEEPVDTSDDITVSEEPGITDGSLESVSSDDSAVSPPEVATARKPRRS